MPPSKGTERHTFRIKPKLWAAAQKTAAENDETVSDAVRRLLEDYAADHYATEDE